MSQFYQDEVYYTKEVRMSICWLEHPRRYDYLRKRYYQSYYRRYFKKGQKVRGVANDFYKLIGYRLVRDASDGEGIFEYELYFLKEYDRGCPNEHPNYARSKLMPGEAVLTSNLLKEGG